MDKFSQEPCYSVRKLFPIETLYKQGKLFVVSYRFPLLMNRTDLLIMWESAHGRSKGQQKRMKRKENEVKAEKERQDACMK